MTKKEELLIWSYVYNNTLRLENEVKQLQSNLRYRKIDVDECCELACAMQQLQTFTEVTNHILLLLKLKAHNE